MLNPVLIRVWFNKVVGIELLLYPVTFPELGVQVHVNNVPATSEVKVILVLVLVQSCFVRGEFVRSGMGLTVTM